MGNFKVGTAKVCITPPMEEFPFPGPIYLGSGVKIEGVYCDIYIRVIAMSNGAETFLFGSFEESNGTDALKEAVEAKFGVPYKNQMYCHIHNHGGIQTSTVVKANRPQMKNHKFNEAQVRMGDMIFEKALEAVGQALDNMQEAKWGFGTGTSYLNVNRDYPMEDGYFSQAEYFDGDTDKILSVIKFTDAQDNVIAAVLNYCCHANATIGATDLDGKMKVSGDFPGFACDYLEKKYPGAVIMWTSGAAGDQNVLGVFKGEKHYSEKCAVSADMGNMPHGFQYAYAQNLGERHAVDADRVLRRIVCHEGMLMKSAVTDVYVPQQEAPPGTNFWLNINMAQNNVSTVANFDPSLVRDGKIVGRHIEDYLPNGKAEDCEVQLFILGDLAVVTVAAELYVNLGKAIKEACPMKNAFVITVTGGHGNRIGYVQDTKNNKNKTFQHFGEAYPCDSDKLFTDGVKKLTEELFY